VNKRLKASQNGALRKLLDAVKAEREKSLKLARQYAQLEVKYLAFIKSLKRPLNPGSAVDKHESG